MEISFLYFRDRKFSEVPPSFVYIGLTSHKLVTIDGDYFNERKFRAQMQDVLDEKITKINFIIYSPDLLPEDIESPLLQFVRKNGYYVDPHPDFGDVYICDQYKQFAIYWTSSI